MNHPFFVHMLGIPGAGKTTCLEILKANWDESDNLPLLGFDQVMHAMPEYQAMPDKIKAFELFELPAREQGYKELARLIDARQSFFFDNGGSASSHLDIVKDAKSKGYEVIIISIKTPITVAMRHVDQRSVSEGRHTPMNYLEDRAQKISQLYESYKALTPHFYELENDGQNLDEFRSQCHLLAQRITSANGVKAA